MESTNILETIDSVPEDKFPTLFVNKLVAILEHSKDEITDLLKTKSVGKLKELRSLVFNEFTTVLPQYASREMYARRKEDLLIEDIYVFSYTAVNAWAHKKLPKCLKPQSDMDSSHVSDIEPESQELNDQQSLIELCIKLQDRIKSLEDSSKTQNDRIIELEKQVTNARLQSILVPRDHSNSQDGSMDQADGGVDELNGAEPRILPPPPPAEDDPPFPPPSYDIATNDVTDERATDAAVRQNSNPRSPRARSQQERAKQGNPLIIPEEEFRHSSTERKRIQKGNIGLRAAVSQNDIRGTSENQHCISAAKQSPNNTLLVYVGNLDTATSEKDLRKHLANMQIQNVSDVIKLTGKYSSRYASFCVSCNSETEMKNMFNTELWPMGVLVRPFRPSRRRLNFSKPTGNSWRNPTKPRQPQRHNMRKSKNNRDTGKNRFEVLQDGYQSRHEDRDDWGYNVVDGKGNHYDPYANEYRIYNSHDADHSGYHIQ